MAILSEATRKKYFKYLGLGEYNNTNLRKLQKTYMRSQDVDGVYGTETDRLLRHLYNVKLCAPSFKPTEFRCTCGHCTGYPSYMKRVELTNLQKIRDYYDRPTIVTSGLRCKHANGSSTGSIQNSLHLVGRACDFYIAGVTDTLEHRKAFIKWAKKLPNTHYIYGNGINSNGVSVYAPYMGNAIHYDVNKAPKKASDPLQKWYDAMKEQFNWSKNQNYKFVTPTVASSKKNGTCITFPAVSLQRLGLLPSGYYFYFNPATKRMYEKGGYVSAHPEIYQLMYPKKTASELWKSGQIKKGDICGFDNPGYHTMVFMGMNSSGQPIWNTMGHKRGLSVTYPNYANRKVDMIVRLKKTSK